ncbi:MAG: 3-keto-disaccharide hydrolase, partial [Candidatus Binatia bacterium]
YEPPPPLRAGEWNEYEIEINNHTYIVRLNGRRTTTFTNSDPARGVLPSVDPDSGYIGLQSYRDSRVGFRNIKVSPL